MEIKSILFVCLGNICRSPLAEAIAKNEAKKRGLDIYIQSAGTGSWHIGENPCENSQIVARNNGLNISNYIARQVTKKDFQKFHGKQAFDLIIGLDKSNVENLKKLGCEKPYLLGSFGYNNEDVPDPYFFDGFEGFDKVYKMIEECIITLFDQTLSKQ